MQCHICNSQTSFFLNKDGYDFWKCPACGLIFVYQQPDTKYLMENVYSLKSGYQKHKENDLSAVKESSHIKKILDFLEFTPRPANNFILKFLPKFLRTLELISHTIYTRRVRDISRVGAVQRLLDVGCSNGEFLYFAKQRGFETYGVELNEFTAQIAIANGLNVNIGTIESVQYADNFFDIIFLGDILEHVISPRALLIECRRVLKSGGTLIISTPNLNSFWAKATFKLYQLFTIPWSVLTPPHHLFQFSENNLKQFLKGNGFMPITAWFRRPPTLIYELGSLHLWGKWNREKTFKNLFFMLFAFAAYSKLYFLDILITPFKQKDFGMIAIFKK